MTKREGRRALIRLAIFIVLLAVLVTLMVKLSDALDRTEAVADGASIEAMRQAGGFVPPTATPGPGPTPTPSPSPTPVPTPTPIPTPLPEFHPQAGASALPEHQITGTAIMVDGVEVDSYRADAAHTIDFGGANDYTDMKGIVTFRGNNFRDNAQYGRAEVTEAKFGDYWRIGTDGTVDSNGNYWGGSGWTGQPLIVEWPAETRRIMNMYDWAKEKDGLVEVIYATLGGKVYFCELETGKATRDTLNLGYTFKGAGALDPRGYPLMYVGGGVVNGSGNPPRIMVVSLIDGEVLYTNDGYDAWAPRGWSAYDSSALVDAETDQLLYPGENGILYLIKLNTRYDPAAGTISVNPVETKFKFTSSTADKYYYGMEDSAIVWRGHMLVADNGGDFVCIDLNTLEIEWCFDCLDDTNCTGVLEVDETGHPYVYLSTSFHLGWRSSSTATIPVWKIDAVTGEEVWHHDYVCYSESGLSGGVQGSLSLGKGSLDGILYVSMARYPDFGNGKLLALDTDTGEELWTLTSGSYSWSTPTCFYDTTGRGYVLYTSCISGSMYMVDGLTGETCDKFDFNCTMEASPVIYNNTVVLGTRNQEIYGITLK